MRRRDEIIKEIGDLVINNLEHYDDYDCDWDEDGLTRASINTSFVYESCEIECNVWWDSHGCAETELLIYPEGKKCLELLEKAVQQYVDEHLDADGILDSIEEDIRYSNADEWESHGFRDAQDYYNWRYG